jgi:hypothetical protein
MKFHILLILLSLTFFAFLVGAEEVSGDGNKIVEVGDIIILDNGWKIQIVGIFVAHAGDQLQFRTVDPDGKVYKEAPFLYILNKWEGKKKFGSEATANIEIEIIGTLGERSDTDAINIDKMEKIELSVKSINENLPGLVEDSEDEEFVNIEKELTWKDGSPMSAFKNEDLILPNGYLLKYVGQYRDAPRIEMRDLENNLIDSFQRARDTSFSIGSFIRVDDYGDSKIDLTVIGGSEIIFGTGWNMFSINLDDGDGFGTILESTCNEAIVWSWDNKLDDYVNLGNLKEGLKLPSKEGLWVKIRTKTNVHADIDCRIITSGKENVILNGKVLNKGWNLIGSPLSSFGNLIEEEDGGYVDFLEFDEVLGDCQIEGGPWRYLSTKWMSDYRTDVVTVSDLDRFTEAPRNKLHPNTGYFIKVKEQCTLGDNL